VGTGLGQGGQVLGDDGRVPGDDGGSALTTGNTIYQNTMMGIYAASGTDGVQSYAATVELQ